MNSKCVFMIVIVFLSILVLSEGTVSFDWPAYPLGPLRPRERTRNTVVVRNELQHHKNLKVHCKSKDDDLGLQIVPPGQAYDFTFKDNFFLTTLFWCNLWQGPNYKHHQGFVAYKATSFPRFGDVFLWDAREAGVYKSKNNEPPQFKFAWDVPHK